MARARRVCEALDHHPDDDEVEPEEEDIPEDLISQCAIARRVDIQSSPYLKMFYEGTPIILTIDTGATSNMIRDTFARQLGIPVNQATQRTKQADGLMPMDVVGKVHCELTRGKKSFQFDALVVKSLDVNLLAGIPFLCLHDIYARPSQGQVVIQGTEAIPYGLSDPKISVRRVQTQLLHSPVAQSILPGDYIDPNDVWPPIQEISSVADSIRIVNTSQHPVIVTKNDKFCQITPVIVPQTPDTPPSMLSTVNPPTAPFSSGVRIDPDNILPPEYRKQFQDLHLQYDEVFNPHIPKYNGASGDIKAVVNMSQTLPPQRKGRVPNYNRATLCELQQKFDELEECGVFAKPESLGINVEYLNLSFLGRKPSGGSRLL